jgi:hypothetical protein
VFHTHWQTLFSQGTESGMGALREVVRRLGEHWGGRAAWTGCADLARYAAAVAGVAVRRSDGVASDGITVATETPFAAPRFTLSVAPPRAPRGVRLDGRPLARAAGPAALDEGSYLVDGARVVVCWHLAGRQEITLDLA